MNKIKKGEIQYAQVIGIILLVISAIILFSFSSNAIANSKYETFLSQCNMLFKTIDGEPTFFTDLNEPNKYLLETISKICPSKDEQITQNSVKIAAELAKDCWYSHGSGVDIMSEQSYNQNVCVFCGMVKAKEDINDFSKKFTEELSKEDYKSLFEESDTANLNEMTLRDETSLPQSLSEGDNLIIYYFIHRPEFTANLGEGFFSDVGEHILETDASDYSEAVKFISGFGFAGTKLAQLLPGHFQDSLTAVSVEKFRSDNKNFDTQTEISFDLSSDLKAECTNFIIPQNHFS